MLFFRKLAITVGLILIVMMVQSLSIVGQESYEEMTPEEQQKAMQEFQELMQPSEHHSYLEPMVGDWDITITMWWGGPGSDSVTTEGTASFEWIMGGRFLLGEFESDFMGQPFTGMSFLGYDNYRNMYHWSLVNSMSTAIEYMTGSVDPSHKRFRFFGQVDEPPLNVSGRTIEYRLTIADSTSMLMEVIDLHAGDDYEVVEIKYERAEEE